MGTSDCLSPTGVVSLLLRWGNLVMEPGFWISLLSPGDCPRFDKSDGTLGVLFGVSAAIFSEPEQI